VLVGVGLDHGVEISNLGSGFTVLLQALKGTEVATAICAVWLLVVTIRVLQVLRQALEGIELAIADFTVKGAMTRGVAQVLY
jgi:hypothetical protein